MLSIQFLTYFVLINFIFMSFSHIMISYVYSGYSAFKNMYPGTEDEYKRLLTAVFHIWRLLLFFFGIIPLITLLILD